MVGTLHSRAEYRQSERASKYESKCLSFTGFCETRILKFLVEPLI